MKYIDNFLNRITMYRLMLYGLPALAAIAVLLGFLGYIADGGWSLLISFFTLGIVCFAANQIFAKIFKVQTNVESEWITGFILFFVAFPPSSARDVLMLALVAVIAMASKYILAWKKKHIFNPAAVALALFSISGHGIGAWWIGSSLMLIPVALFAFLVLRKIKRFSLFFTFAVSGLLSAIAFGLHSGASISQILYTNIVSGPILFFGAIMLTEPLTTPPKKSLQIAYGTLVGLLFGAHFSFGPVYNSPELSLVIGNLFSYIASPRARLRLALIRKEDVTADVTNFVFRSDEKLAFKPGQYLEWTLAPAGADQRGNRRYFTIASSPTEENMILGTKFYPNPSTFKQKLLALQPGDSMISSQLAGDFTMPEDKGKKLVFIAGGIGATPFRSMAKYMIDTQEHRDIIHLYSNKSLLDIAYKNIFDSAESVGWKNIYVVNELGTDILLPNMRTGFITKEMLVEAVPDYMERMFYISGTRAMVVIFGDILRKLGVPKSHIKTDFFPGFV